MFRDPDSRTLPSNNHDHGIFVNPCSYNMVKPSLALCARLRFTTKGVARGFYRGNRTGSLGAHNEYGGYLIDWRKTSHYNVPNIAEFDVSLALRQEAPIPQNERETDKCPQLTPFVTAEMARLPRVEEREDGQFYTPPKVDAMEYLRTWKKRNPAEYDQVREYQAEEPAESEALAETEQVEQDEEKEEITRKEEDQASMSTESDRSQLESVTNHLDLPEQEQSSIEQQPTKNWDEMTRTERKALINKDTVTARRQAKGEVGRKLRREERRAVKKQVKDELRQAHQDGKNQDR